MQHFGDITKINGHNVPITDCVIFGAPCQDLSVAGKRAGMKHSDLGDEETTRSGLFMEAVRIIKEMRETDVHNGRAGHDVRPRYGIYENVPGAFSSNSGEDFRVVLEELARVVEEGVTIPRPAKGKWANTGVIIGDRWSLAWRVFDAQYWGVPQRRRRICIVVDFNGHTAPQIVFSEGEHHGSTERGDSKPSVGHLGEKSRPEIQSLCKGLSRNIEQSLSQREEASTDASGSLGAGDSERTVAYTMQDREGKAGGGKGALIAEEKSATLRANNWQYVFQPQLASGKDTTGCLMASGYEKLGAQEMFSGDYTVIEKQLESNGTYWDGSQVAGTLTAHNAGGGQRMPDKDNFNAVIQPCVVYDARGNGNGDVAPTMTGDHQNRITDYTGVVVTYSKSRRAQSKDDYETWVESNTTNTLNAFDMGDVRTTECVVALDRESYQDKIGSLCARDYKGVGSQYVDEDKLVVETKGPSAVCVARAVDCRNCTEDDINGSLQSNSAHSLNGNNVVRVKYIVRRLTPLECERLQGFPDGWTDIGEFIDTKGKKCKTSDASRYKALGNSIALPSWKFILKRLCSHYERDATMASLFDGIGGFPLLWEQINGKGSCLWASEIEEFPIAVTKERISK